MTWLFRSPSYCPLAGFECSTQWYGHQNVILDGRLTPLFAWASSQKDMDAPRFQGLDLLYSRLTEDHAITVPHTSADTGRRVPWEQCDPRFCKLVEVYQAQRGNYEFEGCLRQSTFSGGFGSYVHDALQAGWKLGFVASTDHGNGASYAGALAERLEPRSLFEALKSRRTFGATVKGLFVDFRVDDALMGEEVACSAPPKVHVTARAPQELAELVVFRDGKPWKSLGRATANRPDSAVGATLVLEPPFKAKPPEKDWVMTFTVDDGEWLAWPLGRRPPQGEKKGRGFSLDPADPHVLRFEWPAGYVGFRPGEMRVRLRAHRDGRVKIDLDGDGRDAREVRVGAMLAHAINGSLGNQSWTLTSYERYDDVVQLDPGLGVRELDHEWIDDELEPGASWYYARITQRDGEMAWSSPIYVSRQ
jgi:hypothetical protein